MSEERQLELIVREDLTGSVRLDQYITSELSGHLESLSRSRIQKLIDDGQVEVDEKKAKAGAKLRGGEVITITIPADVPLDVVPQDIPLSIVFEDDDLVVVNKAAGMVTHPGAGVFEGTLVNALIYHCGGSLSGISGVLRPGIVHRLDKDTSGLLVVAKSDRAHQSLAQQIKEKSARRVYTALVEGSPQADTGIIDKPIGRHPVERKKMAIVESGRQARTHFEVMYRWHKYSLIKATLETGRTHQIRVHMADYGCPVVGDLVYNRKTTGTSDARKKLGLNQHALHAAYLSFTHPITGALLEFQAPLPADFQALIDRFNKA